MSLLTDPKQYIHQTAVELGKKLDTKSARKVRRLTIIIFAILLVADIIFVLPNQFPTFSRLTLDSSPRYSFIIFLWGILTANIFFPRKVKSAFKLKIFGIIGIIGICIGLYIHGNSIRNMTTQVDCETIQSEPQPAFTEIICYNANDDKVDCSRPDRTCETIKYDITTFSKLTLLVVGFVFGFIFWPQVEVVREKGEN